MPTFGTCHQLHLRSNRTFTLAVQWGSYSLHAVDKSRSMLCDTARIFSGEQMVLSQGHRTYRSYSLNLELVEWSRTASHCANYNGGDDGGGHKSNHAGCVDKAIEEGMMQNLGCIPPWIRVQGPAHYCQQIDGRNVTAVRYLELMTQKLYQFMATAKGCQFEACPVPCREDRVTVELVRTFHELGWKLLSCSQGQQLSQ